MTHDKMTSTHSRMHALRGRFLNIKTILIAFLVLGVDLQCCHAHLRSLR